LPPVADNATCRRGCVGEVLPPARMMKRRA
jgi:hypothetical protein